jgi:protease-4
MWTLSSIGTTSYRRSAVAQAERYAEMEIGGEYFDEGGGWSLLGHGEKNLHALLRDLENARRDDDVKGVLLTVKPLSRGFIGPVSANLEEVRGAVLRVREAGKPVVAFLPDDGMAAELFIASAADRIVVPRLATIGQIGVSLEIKRMKRAFEKLGVDWDHDTAGAYKSSFHFLFTDSASAVQREEIIALVEESYRLLVAGIAEGRGIPLERMREIADGRLFSPDEAIEEHLVDAIGWKEDAEKELGILAGVRRPDRLQTSSIAGRTYWTERWTPPPSVAVVGAYGSIESGKSGRSIFTGGRTMGSATVAKQLKAASRQPGLRAIVLRVDSGGGSALASDEILEEIRRIKRERRIPVVVSMGNVAASGGYWISALGDAIFADPSTVTGSIGVVYAKPVLERLYEKAGITNEVYKVGEHADAASMSRRMTEDEKEMLAGHMGAIYDTFIGLVAEGRKMNPDRVRELAGGRVYLGTQALENGLIDRTGGLHDAIEYAASQAGVADDYRTVYFRAFPGFMESIRGEESLVSMPGAVWRLIRGEASGFDETKSAF